MMNTVATAPRKTGGLRARDREAKTDVTRTEKKAIRPLGIRISLI
jgi:hypothetical protein